ncbi:ABC transporter permease [Conexibacter sp. JD483]|uniref:ABC transporter permease n=1 Tax=unclassified Conexibacter TaxID=2627773 RepID=UPI0027255A64|nr:MULTISPECIES: ABC transporter permease [unclassified Conexibacter]MDO8187689.1 ABC transporter permease [Conexibacter sp. CPCC 205706]MDO8199874.1 ABC transporter permease [Conexibacter sp. CPCC 205762]MDR9372233.1 ABC transporter permease [Conexibacter sp. JD483]
MSATESTATELAAVTPAIAPSAATARRIRRSRAVLWLSLPLAFVALVVIVVPLLGVLPDPHRQHLDQTLLPPFFLDGGSMSHPLGTDKLGRDLLSRLVTGGRLTLLIGLVGTVVAIVPGTLIGLLAGYKRGWVDTVVSRFIEAQLALPFVLIALAIIANRGSSLGVLIVVLALTGWAPCARVVRAETMALRERQFVLGLRAAGASSARIVLRHVLPNLTGVIVVLATLQVGTAILVESALSFLNLGIQPPDISWGQILASGREVLTQAWWISTFAGLAITVVVLLVNLLGDALLSHYDPKKRKF